MRKELIYTYLGTNGVVTTPVRLEGIYSVQKYNLMADSGKKLTCDDINFSQNVTVPADDLDKWKEVDADWSK